MLVGNSLEVIAIQKRSFGQFFTFTSSYPIKLPFISLSAKQHDQKVFENLTLTSDFSPFFHIVFDETDLNIT